MAAVPILTPPWGFQPSEIAALTFRERSAAVFSMMMQYLIAYLAPPSQTTNLVVFLKKRRPDTHAVSSCTTMIFREGCFLESVHGVSVLWPSFFASISLSKEITRDW